MPDGTTWEKKMRKTETEMDGLSQPRHGAIGMTKDEVHDRTGRRRILSAGPSAGATPQPSGSG